MRNGAANGCRGQALHVTSDGVRGLRDLTTEQIGGLLQAAHREYAIRFPRGRPAPLPDGVRIIRSTELSLVAYWDNNGVPVIGIERNTDPHAGYHQFGVFVLADLNGLADTLRTEYLRSESAKMDHKIRGLKKMAAEFRQSHQGR